MYWRSVKRRNQEPPGGTVATKTGGAVYRLNDRNSLLVNGNPNCPPPDLGDTLAAPFNEYRQFTPINRLAEPDRASRHHIRHRSVAHKFTQHVH